MGRCTQRAAAPFQPGSVHGDEVGPAMRPARRGVGVPLPQCDTWPDASSLGHRIRGWLARTPLSPFIGHRTNLDGRQYQRAHSKSYKQGSRYEASSRGARRPTCLVQSPLCSVEVRGCCTLLGRANDRGDSQKCEHSHRGTMTDAYAVVPGTDGDAIVLCLAELIRAGAGVA